MVYFLTCGKTHDKSCLINLIKLSINKTFLNEIFLLRKEVKFFFHTRIVQSTVIVPSIIVETVFLQYLQENLLY